jgi:hypothetical protein
MGITVASQKLKAKPGLQQEKAEAIGTSRANVRFWMDGSRKPTLTWIDRVEQVYGIPAIEWEVEPANVPKSKPARHKTVVDSCPEEQQHEQTAQLDPSDIVGGAKEQLRRIAEMRQELDDPRLAVRLEETERACRHTLAVYLGEGRNVTESVLLRSPAFARVLGKIRAVLRKHPDALLDVTEALEAIAD